MTTLDMVLWSLATALGSGAVWLTLPRPPAYDPAVMFGLVVATILRGREERAEGKVEAWEAAVRATVPAGIKPPVSGWTIDPTVLGDGYDLVQRLGIGASWDALAEEGAAVETAVRRMLEGVTLVWFESPAIVIPWVASAQVGPTEEAIVPLLPNASSRVVIAARTEADAALNLLRAAPGLRDRVRAVVLIGASVTDPLAHVDFDTELARTTPWLVLRVARSPVLTEPPAPPNDRRAIGLIDLGEVASTDDSALAVAFAVLIALSG